MTIKFNALASAFALACLVGGTTLVFASATTAAGVGHEKMAHKGGKKSKKGSGGWTTPPPK